MTNDHCTNEYAMEKNEKNMTISAIYVSCGITNDYGQLFTEQYTCITKY